MSRKGESLKLIPPDNNYPMKRQECSQFTAKECMPWKINTWGVAWYPPSVLNAIHWKEAEKVKKVEESLST